MAVTKILAKHMRLDHLIRYFCRFRCCRFIRKFHSFLFYRLCLFFWICNELHCRVAHKCFLCHGRTSFLSYLTVLR